MVALRARMQQRYADWRGDLQEDTGWPPFFDGCPEPDFAAIPDGCVIEDDAPVWPGRRGANLQGAPEGAHISRAFDGIEPEDVRVVVFGQAPYPAIASATGRAFEDGTPDAAGEAVKLALRVLGQSALDLHGEPCPAGLCHGREGRAAVIRGCFDRLAEQGVLCLNVSWTYTQEGHESAHRRLWKPVTAYLLQRLVERPEGSPVLLLLGTWAERFFDGLRLANVLVVRKCHPAERGNRYFERPNPLQRVNEALQASDSNPVAWWSVPDDEGLA